MEKHFDVAIIGAGISGIMAAYELSEKSTLSIALLEQGKNIYKRACPIIEGKVSECINCHACSIMKGFGGAGNFSDGKYNFTTEFGGWFNEYLPDKNVMELIDYVDNVNVKFGATEETFSTSTPAAEKIEKIALEHDLHLLHAKVKHLGTENNLQILKRLYDYLEPKIHIESDCAVTKILPKEDGLYKLETENGEELTCKYLIVAPGRAGAEWFSNQCKELNIPLLNNQVDIGVRVEIPAKVFEHITDAVYESKLVYRTKCHGDKIRTFCMNPYGHVVTENVDGLMTVNGHSYSDPALRSENTNFALLVSNRFTKPFNDPYQYGKRIASLSNLLGGGILVQRFGDLVKGNRTNEHRLSQSFVKPTLNATPGDLSLVIPKRQLDDIIEMIYALDKIAPGMANHDTLLYGVEVKFYSAKPELTNELETKYKNMFAIGDGAGVTRGLAQAAATGVYVARNIIKRLEK